MTREPGRGVAPIHMRPWFDEVLVPIREARERRCAPAGVAPRPRADVEVQEALLTRVQRGSPSRPSLRPRALRAKSKGEREPVVATIEKAIAINERVRHSNMGRTGTDRMPLCVARASSRRGRWPRSPT